MIEVGAPLSGTQFAGEQQFLTGRHTETFQDERAYNGKVYNIGIQIPDHMVGVAGSDDDIPLVERSIVCSPITASDIRDPALIVAQSYVVIFQTVEGDWIHAIKRFYVGDDRDCRTLPTVENNGIRRVVSIYPPTTTATAEKIGLIFVELISSTINCVLCTPITSDKTSINMALTFLRSFTLHEEGKPTTLIADLAQLTLE